jgi:two-component system nitrate/nitrite response regulator NarL
MSKPLRLLIVDDSRASREELSTLLSDEPYIEGIWKARHGLEALSLAEKHKPDVVLLDQNMPGLTGAEVARRMKSVNSKTLIFFVSADPEAKESAMAAGAEAFFVKGVDTASLLQALRNASLRCAA